MARVPAIVAALVAAASTACWETNGTYCQSGPKYGTTCYTSATDPMPVSYSPGPQSPREAESPSGGGKR